MTTAAVCITIIGAVPIPAVAQADSSAARQPDISVIEWLDGPANLLLTVEEMRVARTLDPSAREAFRKWFWARRDPLPETVANELRDELYARVAYANNAFGDPSAGLPGWQTWRGFCWVLLGPPSARLEGEVRISSENGMYDAERWRYIGRSQRMGERDLLITFARVHGRDVLIFGPGRRELNHLQDALSAAVSATIHDPRWAFEAPRAFDLSARELPLEANVWLGDAARDIELSFAVTDLYGEMVDGKLVVGLELSIVRAAGQALQSNALPARTRDAMVVELSLDPDEVSRRSGQPLRVLVRLPVEMPASRYAGALQVIERATGRRALVPFAGAAAAHRQPMPQGYPVDRLLAVSKGRSEGAVAIAFFAPGPDSHQSLTLWLSRGPAAPPAGATPALSLGGMHLMHVQGTPGH